MTNAELIEHAKNTFVRLSSKEPDQALARIALINLAYRLGKHHVRINRTRDGFLMIGLDGSVRFLTWRESLVWLLFRRPPQGYFTLPETPKVRLDLCGND